MFGGQVILAVMKKVVFVLTIACASTFPSHVNAATYKNCSAVNKSFPNGVAVSAKAAARQKNTPEVSSKIYNAHKKMDRDKDGTICEK